MSSYLRLLAAFVAVLIATLAGFNAFIDPYGNFGTPKISGVNELALGFNHRLLLAKSLAVSRIRPASIILGNSRAETGYDPQHPGFTDRPAYNLAIGGARLGELHRYFLESLATGGLRHVVLSVDLTMFDPSPGLPDTGLDTALLTDASGKLAGDGRKWRRQAFVLLSGTASSDGWWSFTHQRKPVAIYRPSGLREESYDIAQVAREGGPRSASIGIESRFLATALLDVSAANFRASYAATLEQLREIVNLAAAHNVRLTMVVNPIHARQNYVLAASGLLPVHEKWKRDLASTASQSPGNDLVSLWDFSGVSPCTAEPFPAAGDAASNMRWYRESSHFRRALGDRVFDRIFGRPDDGVCPGFGQRLEVSTLEAVLKDQRAALRRWVASNPDDAAEIDGMAKRHGRSPSKF